MKLKPEKVFITIRQITTCITKWNQIFSDDQRALYSQCKDTSNEDWSPYIVFVCLLCY